MPTWLQLEKELLMVSPLFSCENHHHCTKAWSASTAGTGPPGQKPPALSTALGSSSLPPSETQHGSFLSAGAARSVLPRNVPLSCQDAILQGSRGQPSAVAFLGMSVKEHSMPPAPVSTGKVGASEEKVCKSFPRTHTPESADSPCSHHCTALP